MPKPMVAILMAVYEPNLLWFREQLQSINEQTYPYLKLYVREDCSPTVSFDDICTCVHDEITTMPYEIIRNPENKGSTLTFQALTQTAEGDYFAYCDQDDIWLSNKIQIQIDGFQRNEVVLVCSDMYMINDNREILANSITKMRKRHIFYSGANLSRYLVCGNFVTGCTILVKKEVAQKAIPFLPEMVHDHWIALMASFHGEILSLDTPLIQYRQHNRNQTGILMGVHDKKTYFQLRVCDYLKQGEALSQRLYELGYLRSISEETERLTNYIYWLKARKAYFLKEERYLNWKIMIKYIEFGRCTVLLETFLMIIPGFLFELIIKYAKRGVI